jgi:hypothetical protein
MAASVTDVRADDCAGPGNGGVIYSNVVGQQVPQYTIANSGVVPAGATVVSGQPVQSTTTTGTVITGSAVNPVLSNGTVIPATYSTTSNYSPMMYSNGTVWNNGYNGVRYVSGYNGWNQPTGYAPAYAGYPGVIGSGVNYGYGYPYGAGYGSSTFQGGFQGGVMSGAQGVPQYYYPGSTVSGTIGNYAGNAVGRRIFGR